MTPDNRNAAIAALVIVLGFGIGAFYLPTIMLAIGSYSPVIAGIFGVLFVAAFFLVFWLRGRQQRRRGR
jgi:protein-S-isoprenylcysteine O-methyltransferase Ste14